MRTEGSLTPSAPPFAKLRVARAHPTLVVAVLAGGTLLLGFLLRLYLTRRIPAPWIMGDELLYSDLARSFADNGQVGLRGVTVGTATYGLYPIVISPAWLFDSTVTAYGVAKAINALLMTLAAVPLYFWARRLVRAGYALCLLGLVLLLPASSYAGTLMTENVAFPAVALALFAIAVALERATTRWQVIAFAAMLLAVASRVQNVVFFVILPTAVVLKVLLDARATPEGPIRPQLARGLRTYLPTWIGLAGLALAYALYQVARGRPLSGGLGAYQALASTHYVLRDVGRWVVLHLAEVGFAVAIVPLSALILMFGLGWSREFATTAAERSFLAVAAASLWFVVQAGAFASHFIQRIEERNMIYVEPLLLLAFVLWLERGAPRPPRLTLTALLVPATLLTTIPFERLFNVSIFSDTPGLLPLFRVSSLVSGGSDGMRVLLALGAIATCLFFALAPRRVLVFGGIAGITLFLAVSTKMVVGSQRSQAVAAKAAPGVTDSRWVDESVPQGKAVGLLFTPEFSADAHPLWQTEIWNRSVQHVFYLGARDFAGFPGYDISVNRTGELVSASGNGPPPAAVDYMVASPNIQLAGSRVKAAGRFVLYRIAYPLRLSVSTEGVYTDGWTGPEATYTRYVRGARTVRIDLSRAGWSGPDVPGSVRVELVKTDKAVARRAWIAHRAGTRSFTFPAPPAPFSVRIHVTPTFSPVQFGLGDTRQLGVQVSFTTLPR